MGAFFCTKSRGSVCSWVRASPRGRSSPCGFVQMFLELRKHLPDLLDGAQVGHRIHQGVVVFQLQQGR